MYDLSEVRKGLKNPARVVGEVRKNSYKINRRVHSLAPKRGVSVMEEDWDNLLILDAARYDMFEEVADLNGELTKRKSLGSTSPEFVSENFMRKTFHDTVYVTANPYYELLDEDVFHEVIPLLDEWDDEIQTVHPSEVVSTAIEAHTEHPNKRLIVHFMQPHIPFIGEKGQEIGAGGWTKGIDGTEGLSVWNILMYGHEREFTRDEVIAAYLENHKIAIEYARKLSEEILGKTVLTADHANLVGERMSPIPARAYGHITGLREPPLVEVPWQTLPYQERKKITSEPPVSGVTEMDKQQREKRLKALGYK